MKSKVLKAISIMQVFVLIVGMCTAFMCMKADAAALGITPSAAYQSSVYYQRACEAYSKYSDPRTRFVQIALSQKGYKGGTASGQWAGNGSGGKITEYGRYMKKDGLDWCASFVSWCAAAAGIPKNVISQSAGAGHWKNVKTGTYTPIWSNNFTTYNPYKPQVGDLCLYMPYHDKKGCYLHYNAQSPTAHVVIVASVNSQQNANGSWTFTTIERGNNNTVESHKITTKDKRNSASTCKCGLQTPAGTNSWVVQGFYRPDWSLMGADYPEDNGGGGVVTANVKLTQAVQSDYVAKEFIAETNACVVTQITKPNGSHVSQCGLVLMDAKGNVLKNHIEDVKVGNSTTLFHSWYDINSEVGYTLTKATTYKYRFFTIVDGVRYEGETRSFTTKGEVTTFHVSYDADGAKGSMASETYKLGDTVTVKECAFTSEEKDFYKWVLYRSEDKKYMSAENGWQSVEAMRQNGYNLKAFDPGNRIILDEEWTEGCSDAISFYFIAAWKDKVVETIYTVGYDSNGGRGSMNGGSYRYSNVVVLEDCDFTNNGREFLGWMLYRSEDNTYLTLGQGWQTQKAIDKNDGYIPMVFSPGNKVKIDSTWIEDCGDATEFYFVALWNDEEEEEDEEVVIKLYIDNPRMKVNGKSKNIDSQGTVPCIINDRTMLPIRAVIEALGGTVGWNQNLQQVTLKLDGKTLYLRIGDKYAFDDEDSFKLDSAPVLKDGRTLLPVRAVVEYFGGSVAWDNPSRCVTIRYSK